MHFENGHIPTNYSGYIKTKTRFLYGILLALFLLIITSICLGSVPIDVLDVLKALLSGSVSRQTELIIWNIRLPQTLTAVVAGAGLACSGAVMQSVLRNPLASPFTLGISHAAAFGAALSVIVLGSGVMASGSSDVLNILNPFLTIFSAFSFSMLTAGLIIYISSIRGASPQVMVLTGVALGSLFIAGTMLLQFFADDIQLAAMVFWTFGDLARADWNDLWIISGTTVFILIFFFSQQQEI